MKNQRSVLKTAVPLFALVLAISLHVTPSAAQAGESGTKEGVPSGFSTEEHSLRGIGAPEAKRVLGGPRLRPYVLPHFSRVDREDACAQAPSPSVDGPGDASRGAYGDEKGRTGWGEFKEAVEFLGLLAAGMAILLVSLCYLELVDPSP